MQIQIREFIYVHMRIYIHIYAHLSRREQDVERCRSFALFALSFVPRFRLQFIQCNEQGNDK